MLRATTACTFSTSQLPKVVRTPQFLTHFTSKCASRDNGVQLFISHLPRCLRTRRFSEPTFQPSGATKPRKNTVFRGFPTFSRTCIFFLLIFSLLTLLPADCFFISPYCRKFDFQTSFEYVYWYIYIYTYACVCVCVCVRACLYMCVCVDILQCIYIYIYIIYIYAIKSQLYICCIHSPNHLVHFRTHGSYHLHEKNPSETSSQQLLIQLAIQAPHRLRRRGSPGTFGVQGVQRRQPRFGGKGPGVGVGVSHRPRRYPKGWP